MSDITATKINEVYSKILCSDSINAELREYFSFKIPDYQFNPMVRAHKWDGMIRLYNKRNHYLFTGLLRYLYVFAKERDYTVEFDQDLSVMNNFSLKEAEDYIKSLNATTDGKALIAWESQILAFAKAIRYKRMLMLSPTASGKSFIIYCIINYLLTHGCKKGLIVVPTTSLVEQMTSDFADYSAANGWDIHTNVQKIYEGHSKALGTAPVVISTWQSIYEMQQEGFFDQFDFVIGDEAHTFKAKSLSSIMTKLVNAQYRIGTTGTLDGVKVNKLAIEGHFGPVSKITTTKQMMDEGHAAELSIKSLVLKHPEGTVQKIENIARGLSKKNPGWNSTGNEARLKFQAEIEYIISCEARNKFIRNLVLSLNGNTLLLFQLIEKHGQVLYELIKSNIPADRKLFFVHGGTETADREAIRAIVETESNAIIAASYGVFSTGINIKNLHNIIFASPSKSRIRVLQSIGRSLRLGHNKTHATLYDIADDFRINITDPANYTLKHYAERMLMYYAEKFKVSNYTIQLK